MPIAWMAAMSVGQPAEPRRWEDEIVYAIIIEKFADGDPSNDVMKRRFADRRGRFKGGFWGGDLKGVLARIDEIADLGVTAILLYPVVQNDQGRMDDYLPTGYRPKDYDRIDENFGTLEDLRAVVDGAHARGLRVILDMPISLPGFEHPFLSDPAKQDWIGEPTEYGVPRWNVENPEVADYLIDVCKRWKERSGCDGYRLDSAQLHPVAFWKRFVAEVKAAPPSGPFLLLAELTLNPEAIGRFVAEAGFDGAYDFSALRSREVFGQGGDVGLLAYAAGEAHEYYPEPRRMIAPIDNYEEAFVAIAEEPKAARVKLALTYVLTIDRVPLLYAGNELGIAFDEVGGAFPPGRTDSPFLADFKALIALRRNEPALRRGDFTPLIAEESTYAFVRTLGDDSILVVFNNSAEPKPFAMPLVGRDWTSCRLDDLLREGEAKAAGDRVSIQVGAFGSRVLKVR